jgi:hypothetical protein
MVNEQNLMSLRDAEAKYEEELALSNNGHKVLEMEYEEIPDFPVERLPIRLRAMANEVVDNFKIPYGLVAPMLISAVSCAMGKGVKLESGKGKKSKGNLFIIASAESGSGKSLAYKPIFKPIEDYEFAQSAQFEQLHMPKIQTEISVLEDEIKILKKNIGKSEGESRGNIIEQITNKNQEITKLKKKLVFPSIYCSDVTIEKLEMLMDTTGGVISILSADARKVFKNILGRHSKDSSPEDSTFLIGWTGDSDKIDRVGRDSIHLQEPCLSMFLAIQPDKLEEMFSKAELHDGGFLARCLVCHSNAEPQELEEEVA